MSLVPGRLVVIGSLGMFLRLYLQMSPLLLLALSAVALIFSSSGATARETFAPVNRSEVSSGLRWGVAAVQGRRPYMEDMYQVRARPSRAPPPLPRHCAPHMRLPRLCAAGRVRVARGAGGAFQW